MNARRWWTRRATGTSPRSSASPRRAAPLLRRRSAHQGHVGRRRHPGPPARGDRAAFASSSASRIGSRKASCARARGPATSPRCSRTRACRRSSPCCRTSSRRSIRRRIPRSAPRGCWQFMRSTGRRYMRIDNAIDDRLDPFRSTEAAAQLLRLQLSRARHLAARAHRLQPRRRRHAPREGRGGQRMTSRRSSATTRARRSASPPATSTCRSSRRSRSTATPKSTSATSSRWPEVKFQEITTPSFVLDRLAGAHREGRARAAALARILRCCRPCGRRAPRPEGLSPASAARRREVDLGAAGSTTRARPSSTPVSRRIAATRFARGDTMAIRRCELRRQRRGARRAQRPQRECEAANGSTADRAVDAGRDGCRCGICSAARACCAGFSGGRRGDCWYGEIEAARSTSFAGATRFRRSPKRVGPVRGADPEDQRASRIRNYIYEGQKLALAEPGEAVPPAAVASAAATAAATASATPPPRFDCAGGCFELLRRPSDCCAGSAGRRSRRRRWSLLRRRRLAACRPNRPSVRAMKTPKPSRRPSRPADARGACFRRAGRSARPGARPGGRNADHGRPDRLLRRQGRHHRRRRRRNARALRRLAAA